MYTRCLAQLLPFVLFLADISLKLCLPWFCAHHIIRNKLCIIWCHSNLSCEMGIISRGLSGFGGIWAWAWHRRAAFTQHCDNIIKLMQNYCANCSWWISMRILYGALMCKQVNNNHLDNLHLRPGNWILFLDKKTKTNDSIHKKNARLQ